MDDQTQFLTFTLDSDQYALQIFNVREVLEIKTLTRLPRMPDWMKGVLNIRGSVVPVIDLRKYLGMERILITNASRIIVVELQKSDSNVIFGCLADSVQEVITLSSASIEPAPRMGFKIDSGFINGIGKRDDQFIVVLSIAQLFGEDEELLTMHALEQEDEVEETKTEGVSG